MVPFLLPLLECAPEGSLTRSAPQLCPPGRGGGLGQWDGLCALSMGLSCFFMFINGIHNNNKYHDINAYYI